jgi:hypothetical protein
VALVRPSTGSGETPAGISASSGIVVICANCRRIRDEQGHWHREAIRVQDHPDVEFSHAICPACMQALYPEYAPEGG